MRKAHLLFSYLSYLKKAKTAHGVHSPFVYDFVSNILNDRTIYPEYYHVNQVRRNLLGSEKIVEITDFGAGAGRRKFNSRFRKVSDIARMASVPEKTGQLLFRIVKYFKPVQVLELGTSLGISTLYLALANPDARVITLEGCASTAMCAQEIFNRLELDQVDLHLGSFNCTLGKVIDSMPAVDFAFIDGNHTYASTLQYYEACLSKSHNGSIIVFDDIYWSSEMKRAWKQIMSHPQVSISIDLFRIGIVFFRKELSHQHFVIR